MIETVANRTTCRSATHCCIKKSAPVLFVLLFLFTVLIISTRVGGVAGELWSILCIMVAFLAFGTYFKLANTQPESREQKADESAALEASELAAALSAVSALEGRDAVSVLEGQGPARQEAHDLAEALELSEVLAVVGALEESAGAGTPEADGRSAAVVPSRHRGGGSQAGATWAHGDQQML